MASWKDTISDDTAPSAPKGSSWRDSVVDEDGSSSIPTPLDSAGKGLQSGATLGFNDELAGIGGYLGNLIAKHTSGLDEEGKKKFEQAVLSKAYKDTRDQEREEVKVARNANPGAFGAAEIGGGLIPAALSGGSGVMGGIASGAAQGAVTGIGGSESDDLSGMAKDAAMGAGLGAGAGLAGGLAGKLPIGKALAAGGEKLKGAAEKFAVNATGATGKQASKFSKDAGRELLDRGLVKFGDDAAKIGQRVGGATDAAGQAIGDALEKLEAQGATVDVNNVVRQLEEKALELSEIPGNEKIVKEIKAGILNLIDRGQAALPINKAEQAKRAFQSQVNYASPEAEKKGATAIADAFRGNVEESALSADPEMAKKFMEQKKLFGLLAPIREAAEKRASTLNQSPLGGLLDVATAGSGAAAAGPIGGVAAPIARRQVANRLSSSAAVGADKLGDILAQSPEKFGKFASVLQNAAKRGGQSLGATHFVLQSTNPEYRRMLSQEQDDNQQ